MLAQVSGAAGPSGPAVVLTPTAPYGTKPVGVSGLTADQVQDALAIRNNSERELVENAQFIGARGELVASEVDYAAHLAKLLDHQAPEVVAAAAEALGNMGSAGARYADDIVATLSSPSAQVKCASAYALGQFGPMALQHCARLASLASSCQGNGDAEVKIRVCALQALGQLGAVEHASTATSFLGDSASEVQAAAVLSLAGMGATKSADDIARKLGQDGTRLAAITALGILGAEVVSVHGAAIVAKGLRAADMQSRGEAITALGKCANSSAAAALASEIAPLLGDPSPAVRASAALAVGGLGEAARGLASKVAALLTDMAEDQTWLPQQVGGGAPREPMAMRKPRCAAVLALGAIGSAEHAKSIGELLADTDWEMRFCALEALAGLGSTAKDAAGRAAALLEDEAYPVRAKACIALAAMGADDEAERVVELLQDKAQAVRAEAVSALAALGGSREYTSELAKLLTDMSNNVRANTVRAFASLGEVGRPYASLLAGLLTDPQADVRTEVCVALAGMGSHGAAFAEDVAILLSDPSPMARAAAARALGEMGEGAVPYLSQLRQLAGNDAGAKAEDQCAAEATMQKLEALGLLALEAKPAATEAPVEVIATAPVGSTSDQMLHEPDIQE